MFVLFIVWSTFFSRRQVVEVQVRQQLSVHSLEEMWVRGTKYKPTNVCIHINDKNIKIKIRNSEQLY